MCGPHHCLGRGASASDSEMLRPLLQRRQNASVLEQGCTSLSLGTAHRCHSFTRRPWRTSPPLRPRLSFRYTQVCQVRHNIVHGNKLELDQRDVKLISGAHYVLEIAIAESQLFA